MMKVIVGSKNPMKLETTKEAFAAVFSDEQIEYFTNDSPSGVADQPFGSTETKQGAENRAQACLKAYPDADYFVGLEGGIAREGDEQWVFAWMCIMNKEGKKGFGKTSSFMLPPAIADLINEGMELGHATDKVFDDTNSKHRGGAIGFLTDDLVTRSDFYKDALIFALIPFLKTDLYSK